MTLQIVTWCNVYYCSYEVAIEQLQVEMNELGKVIDDKQQVRPAAVVADVVDMSSVMICVMWVQVIEGFHELVRL